MANLDPYAYVHKGVNVESLRVRQREQERRKRKARKDNGYVLDRTVEERGIF